MKKTSITSLTVALILLATIASSCSKNLLPQVPETDTGFVHKVKAEENKRINRTEVNIKAARKFYEEYGEQQNALWFRTTEGFVVSFEKDAVKTMIHYTTSGSEERRVNCYFEEKLPPAVRHIVKSNFYDFSILYVTEVQKNDAVAFFIKMQDSTKIKTIKMVDGEWEVIEDLVRK